ncbi:hypothetical protein CJ739_2676 [Mariniflexile rhizosphaerae]|uniref:hypothetical protein n=1 Tax=unclassified Mariniflexile TaxID=2643887 RepID=UPI000CC9CDBC|nr:hypothetical protein [Mariniflexile sp. TRM1-10]AXP81748.1 hypothetical protein CJ739_2676 [Mariniflexile sp. TRM1-10]PLB20871.1 MAG: hypothetical protein TRG1_439 [Flavobacteriaceae bacterium FS1-H7996/R]
MGILETFGFKKILNLTVDKEKSKFIEFLQQKTKPNRLFFFDIFDQEQKEFYGKLSMEKFWLRKKSQSLFPESPFASAEGKIKSSSNKTELEIKLIGWNWFVLFWLLGMSLVFALALNDIIRTESYGVLIIFVPVYLILYSLGIFKIRKGVKKLEHYIITELK